VESGYSDNPLLNVSFIYEEATPSVETRGSEWFDNVVTGALNSIGVLSEVLSTVMDLPCRGGV
jgi:hypothetical protein